MPSPELDILTGVSFTWSEAPLLAARKIVDVALPGAELDVFDSSDQSTPVARTFIPADVYDCGNFEFSVQHKQDADYFSELGAEGELVVTLPSGGAGILTFNGILQSYKPQNTPFNEPMYADVVVKVSGDVAVTPTA